MHILLAIFHLWAFLMQSMFHCCFVCRSLMKPFNSWYWKFDSCRSVAYWSKKWLDGWPEKYSATHQNFFMFIAHSKVCWFDLFLRIFQKYYYPCVPHTYIYMYFFHNKMHVHVQVMHEASWTELSCHPKWRYKYKNEIFNALNIKPRRAINNGFGEYFVVEIVKGYVRSTWFAIFWDGSS